MLVRADDAAITCVGVLEMKLTAVKLPPGLGTASVSLDTTAVPLRIELYISLRLVMGYNISCHHG